MMRLFEVSLGAVDMTEDVASRCDVELDVGGGPRFSRCGLKFEVIPRFSRCGLKFEVIPRFSRCGLKFEGSPHFPKFDIPEGETEYSYLVKIARAGALKRYSRITRRVEERLERELDTIRALSFCGYFPMVKS